MNQLNGHSNGKGKNPIKTDSQMLTSSAKAPAQPCGNSPYTDFEQSVVLRQSPFWLRAIMFTFNKTRIADIDSQFMRIILNNEQRIADLNNRISQAKLNFEYQEVRATVAGTVFDLQAKNPGFVANASQKLLQIVPDDKLIAQVFITNRDIGFVREGMRTDVRIDSFPFSQFGDIKEQLVSIGSHALPPDETYQFYRFPATISLDQQYLDINGRNIYLHRTYATIAKNLDLSYRQVAKNAKKMYSVRKSYYSQECLLLLILRCGKNVEL